MEFHEPKRTIFTRQELNKFQEVMFPKRNLDLNELLKRNIIYLCLFPY